MERRNHEAQQKITFREDTPHAWKKRGKGFVMYMYSIFFIFIWRNRLKEINNNNKGKKVTYGGNKQIYLEG